MGGPTNDALADDAVAAISDAALNRTIMDEERNMVGAVHIMSNSPIYLQLTRRYDAYVRCSQRDRVRRAW